MNTIKTKRLYHFTSGKFGLEIIKSKSIKIGRLTELNDLFELLSPKFDNANYETVFENVLNKRNQIMGIISFSDNIENPLVWGHYADKGTGLALGFDINIEHIGKIKYRKNRPELLIEFDNNGKPTVNRKWIEDYYLLTKYKDWKYERESRIFVKLEDSELRDSMYFHRIDSDLSLAEVVIGPKCTLTYEDICECFSSVDNNVVILKARIDKCEFKILK